jgi:hypothetical protein
MENTHSLSLIDDLSREHFKATFPNGVAGIEVAGICVTLLDSYTAGCIHSFLDSGGALDRKRVDILDSCCRVLAVVMPQLTGKAKEYFARLERLATLVIESTITA